MEYIKHNLKPILIVFVIFGGLIVSLILIKNPTIFKSKAAADIDYPEALNITDSSNQPLNYKGEGVYVIKGDKIKLGIKDFDKLVQIKELNQKEVMTRGLGQDYADDFQRKIGGRKLNLEELKQWIAQLPKNDPTRLYQLDEENTTGAIFAGKTDEITGHPETGIATVKQYPPLSNIPNSCKSIGPTPNFILPKPYLNLKHYIDNPITTPEGFVDPEKTNEVAKKQIYEAPLLPSMSLFIVWGYSGFKLPIRWEDQGNKPLTQGGEDLRWVNRTLRLLAALEYSRIDKDRSGDWVNNGGGSWITNEALDVWYKRNGQSLDTACQKVLELKEQLLLQGIWLPSDDKLEEIGKSILGQ